MTRREAVEAVLRSERGGGFLDRVVDQGIATSGLEPREAAFLRALAFGSVRRRLTLDTVIAAFSKERRPPRNRRLLEILRQAVFQILFLDRVPAHAAVNEAVEMATLSRSRAVGGFANGLLRGVLRGSRRLPAGKEDADGRAGVEGGEDGRTADRRPIVRSRRSLPLEGRGRIDFDRDVFSDPDRHLPRYLAEVHSHPEWLVMRWIERFGDPGVESLLRAGNEVPWTSLRVHRLRATREAVLDTLHRAGVRAEPGHLDDSVLVDEGVRVDGLPGFAEGLFAVQGEAAIEAADLVGAAPGEKILEVGAAPGGKTMRLAERMENRGLVVAADASPARLRRLVENRERLGASIVAPVAWDGRALPPGWSGRFDRVLLDAPCSNSGVLARRPEARWRIDRESLRALAGLQEALLRSVGPAARPGGIVAYATCSLEDEENGQVARRILEPAGFLLETERLRLPGDPFSEGGYTAVWRAP